MKKIQKQINVHIFCTIGYLTKENCLDSLANKIVSYLVIKNLHIFFFLFSLSVNLVNDHWIGSSDTRRLVIVIIACHVNWILYVDVSVKYIFSPETKYDDLK